jgi:hypothetical protein
MTFLSKFPFFDSVDNALSDLTAAARRLEHLAIKHGELSDQYAAKAKEQKDLAARAARVMVRLDALTE